MSEDCGCNGLEGRTVERTEAYKFLTTLAGTPLKDLGQCASGESTKLLECKTCGDFYLRDSYTANSHFDDEFDLQKYQTNFGREDLMDAFEKMQKGIVSRNYIDNFLKKYSR